MVLLHTAFHYHYSDISEKLLKRRKSCSPSILPPAIKCLDFVFLRVTQDFLNMEFAFKYELWELLRHEKFPETHVD